MISTDTPVGTRVQFDHGRNDGTEDPTFHVPVGPTEATIVATPTSIADLRNSEGYESELKDCLADESIVWVLDDNPPADMVEPRPVLIPDAWDEIETPAIV